MELRKLDFILDQFNSYSGNRRPIDSNSFFVLCPFHSEKTPSFRIFASPNSKSPGFGLCYGCGWKGGYDEYAEKLGLKPFAWTKPSQQFARPLVKPSDIDAGSERLHFSKLPPNKIWREIKTNLLLKIGCRMVTQWNTKFIYMPVNILGQERGYIRARLKKEKDKPSYLNKKGKWSESYGLFPFDFALRDRPKTVVLVEGPRDALRLLSLGIPAMAILGTQSWSNRKSNLIEIGGVKDVILCFDGDDAGLKARDLVTPLLKKLVNVHVFDLCGRDSPYWPYRHHDEPSKQMKKEGVEGWDPGNMPLSKVRQLKELYSQI